MSGVSYGERHRRMWIKGFLDGVKSYEQKRVPPELEETYREGNRRGVIARQAADREARKRYLGD